MPIDVEKDLFINMHTCPVDENKKTSVNKWLNGNNKIYKRNKNIYLKWIEFIEEIEPKWNKLSKEKQLKVKEIIFEKYNIKEKFEEQIIENLKEARKLIYEN